MKNKDGPNRPLSSKVSPETREKIDELAFRLQRTRSEVADRILGWALKRLSFRQAARIVNPELPAAKVPSTEKSIKKALDGQRVATG